MNRLFIALLFYLCITPVFASDSDIPLLCPDESLERSQTRGRADMEEVVIQAVDRINVLTGDGDIPERHPANIFPRDVWKIILCFVKDERSSTHAHELYPCNLVKRLGGCYSDFDSFFSLRLTAPYFTELLNQDAAFVEYMFFISSIKLRRMILPQSADAADYATRILALSHSTKPCKIIFGDMKAILREYSKNLWALRYGPGMSRDLVLDIAELIDLPLDPSPLSTLKAMRLGYMHTSRWVGLGIEFGKPLIIGAFSALALCSIWTSPYRVASDCYPVFITNFPAHIGWVDAGSFRTLYAPLGLSFLSAAPFLSYFGTVFAHCNYPFEYSWEMTSYLKLERTHKILDHRKITKGRILGAVSLCGLLAGTAVGAYFLLADTYAIPWFTIKLGDYIQLAHDIQNKGIAGCCSMRIGHLNVGKFCYPWDYNVKYTEAELALPQIWARAEYIVPYGQMILVILPMLLFFLDTLFWFIM